MSYATSAMAVILCLATTAHAQPSANAEQAFRDGRALLKAGDVTAACEKFEESQALEAATGTLLNLGDCYEKLGRTATAWAAFRKAADLSKQQNRPGREAEAKRRADALESQLVYVRADIAETIDGMAIVRDDDVPFLALDGSEVPVDPGTHSFQITAPGRIPHIVTVTADEPGAVVVFEVPALQRDEAVPAAALEEPAPDPVLTRLDTTARSRRRRIAVGIAGAGAIAGGVAFAFGQSARSKWDEAQSRGCVDNRCTTRQGFEAARSANRRGLAADVFVGVAASALITSGVVWLTAPAPERVPITVAPSVGNTGAGLTLTGRF